MRMVRPDLHHAVQVCEHIVRDGKPALWGGRSGPDSIEDSGWQFRCSADTVELPTGFKYWSVEELLQSDPAICLIINCPHGAVVERSGPDDDWRVSSAIPKEQAGG